MPVVEEAPLAPVAHRLTHREMTIVYLMSAGNTTPEIAKLLELRPRTVENHKRHIYEKLGVGSQSHAVAKAIWLGLLQPGRPQAAENLYAPVEPRAACDPGRGILAVLMGQASGSRDEVATILVSERVPLVVARKRDELIHDHWLRWNRAPIVVVLVDPVPEDWSAATSLHAPTVVICGSDVPGQLAIASALAHNAGGLVTKKDVADGLGAILSVVAQGFLVMSLEYAQTLMKWAPSPSLVVPELTARERDILGSIACGHTIRQTARSLGIAAKTVENTQARLFRKLGARNRMEALSIADAQGLIRQVSPVGGA
ncbi:MAG TPA: LuxR C-terminal-related transcriptional regulator [Streptosporangiaceae bacterium]|nr:LuxR C-terminal-related transcriptional regulator [Streptosporangiaceae bacterium]